MENIEEDPAPTMVAGPNKAMLVKLVQEELCNVFMSQMKADPKHERTKQFVMTPANPLERTRFGRKTQPIPLIKEVWFVAVLLDEDADPMAMYVSMDGTPYCSHLRPGSTERRLEVTESFLHELSVETLSNMLTAAQEKRSTLELLGPV